ncbi:MAG: acyltransferase, partial [Candidatus Eremiobacteraeota bacterium]|nr:acyltransferase [Candidatus Eremiobacteraeota bacterium]
CYHTWLFSWLTPQWSLAGKAVPIDVLPRTGYLGVDLFFLISGFVLFYPYAVRSVRDGPPHGIGEYAYRRFIKIVPSYVLVLAVTVAVALPLFGDFGSLAVTVAQHAMFVHSFFADALGPANSVFWSLAIEVQFYVIFPAAAWAFRRRPALVFAVMVATALLYRLTMARCCLLDERIMRELPAFLDVFASGMLAAYFVARFAGSAAARERYMPLFTALAVVCASATFVLLMSANAVQYDPGGRERWDVWHRTAFASTLAAGAFASCFAQRWWRALLTNAVLRFLSLISYNLYLWHTLVMIWLWKHGVPRAATANPHDDDHWKLVYIALGWSISIGLATATTYFVERPLLATVKPQRFAFDWRLTRTPRGEPSKRRT